MKRTLPAILLGVATACSGHTAPSSSPAPSATAPTPAAPDLAPPPAVAAPGDTKEVSLAKTKGINGDVEVVQVGAARVLSVGGSIQAIRVEGALQVDPIIALIKAHKLTGKRALVIGLGTGKTATDLAAAGYAVEAVELEPAVVEYARTYFGYRGHAVVGDGLEYLRAHKESYDLIVVDAFKLASPPYELMTPEAKQLTMSRVGPGGVAVIRLLDEPRQPHVARIARGYRDAGSYRDVRVFGSGVGLEFQNIYIVVAERPLPTDAVTDLPLWPVPIHGDQADFAAPEADEARSRAEQHQAARTISLVGYLTTMPDGSPAVDLAHWEMGAIRYQLAGDAKLLAGLAAQLPAGTTFPTSGDIGADGDLKATLAPVLGGGGVKRSEQRFSPVIVALTGTARLRAVVHPDAAWVKTDDPTSARRDPRLPYGGTLYQLDVATVHWSLDRAGWSRLQAELTPMIDRAARAILTGDLVAARQALDEHAARLDRALPVLAQHIAPRAELAAAMSFMDTPAGELGAHPDTLAIAIACDHAYRWVEDDRGDLTAPEAERIAAALDGCRMAHYDKAAAANKLAGARTAASRLVHLLLEQQHDGDPRLVKRRLDGLYKKFRDLQPMANPPPRTP